MSSFFKDLKAAWTLATEHNTGLLAAGVAYYAFLSFMPLLAAAVLSYGLFTDPETLAAHTAELSTTLPASAGDLVTDQLESVTEARSGTSGIGLVLAIALSLFGARLAAGAIISAFNVAFCADENRGLVRSNLLALVITAGALVGLGIVGLATGLAATILHDSIGPIISFALVGLFGFGSAILAYRVVPNIEIRHVRSAVPGAALFAIGWMIASGVFGFYATSLTDYNATYGSLGAVVIFLTWLYISAYLLLIGAHLVAVRLSETLP